MEGKPGEQRGQWKIILCQIAFVLLVVFGLLGLNDPDFSPLTIALCSFGMWMIGLGAVVLVGFFVFGVVLNIVFEVQIHQEKANERIQQALEPRSSLLRAGKAPSTPQEVLVRPALATSENDLQQLL